MWGGREWGCEVGGVEVGMGGSGGVGMGGGVGREVNTIMSHQGGSATEGWKNKQY